jgi:P27 family predicted phage terminase small subunit
MKPPTNFARMTPQASNRPPRPQLPAAPKTLSAEAKRWWKSILLEFEISDRAGLLLLQTCLDSFTRMRQAQVLLDADGLTTVDRYGQHKQHPAAAIERGQRAQMLAALKALNLDVMPLSKAGRPATR